MKRLKDYAIVAISDLHSGCRLGLFPPGTIKLDEGMVVEQSRIQAIVWGWWREFWDEFVPMATKGLPFALVVNGDATDGVHHGSVSQISQNLADQSKIARKVLEPVVKLARAGYYHVRGTEAHAGKSGQEEERLAKALGAVPNKDEQYARYELWKVLGDHTVHFNHHIGTTGSSHHETSALNAEVASMLTSAARWGYQPASVVVRSHRHNSIEVRIPRSTGYITGVITPGWQAKTGFAFKVAGARQTPPQFGGVVIRLDSDGHPFTQAFVRHITPDAAE